MDFKTSLRTAREAGRAWASPGPSVSLDSGTLPALRGLILGIEDLEPFLSPFYFIYLFFLSLCKKKSNRTLVWGLNKVAWSRLGVLPGACKHFGVWLPSRFPSLCATTSPHLQIGGSNAYLGGFKGIPWKSRESRKG